MSLSAKEKAYQSWADFLNPDVMRPRLISASLYIAWFEAMKDSVETHPREFFSNYEKKEGQSDFIVDLTRYKSEVLSLSLDKHGKPDGNAFKSGLEWLKKMNAIDAKDMEVLKRLTDCRNKLAHELLSHAAEGLPPDFEQCMREMAELHRKIEVWWIMNVEVPTNPDWDGRDVDETDVVPGSQWGFQLMLAVALGDAAEKGGKK